jgi:heme/copper-type cytochrome/quinol oxidase subunit 3
MLAAIVKPPIVAARFRSFQPAVEATSLYWHFVDVVWILLFSTLYFL